jgi:hypothetical protein
MKRIEYALEEIDVEWIFSPVRSKPDIICFLMRVIKLILISKPSFDNLNGDKAVLIVSKMSRIFFISPKKHFSICLPFKIRILENSEIKFYSKCDTEMTSMLTSQVLSVLESDTLMTSGNMWDFTAPVMEIYELIPDFWSVFRELLIFEEGYIRYDHDIDNADEDLHPLHHLDVCYSSSPSFKLGLKGPLTAASLIDALEPSTNCSYLTPNF